MIDAQMIGDFLEESDHCNSQGVPVTYPDEVYVAYATIQGAYTDDPDELISDAEDAYYGEFDSDAEFAENMASDLGMIQEDAAWPYNRIDWEAAASDLMMDYTEQDRYYFRD